MGVKMNKKSRVIFWLWNNVFMVMRILKTTRRVCFVLTLLLLSSCSISYVIKQGFYQFKLLSEAKPIEKALRSKDLDKNTRKKLELILDVRSFAAQKLKLSIHKNYQDVNLDWHHTIHTVSASEALKFKPYLWWFPVIGFVPYKGFFLEKDADKEAAKLLLLGYEIDKREVSGYSTLGYFSDPVWPDMLLMNDFGLIELIIHELAHATLYIPNQTPFNETFANFVGKKGATAYIENRYGISSRQMEQLNDYNKRVKLYSDFFHNLYNQLDTLYNSNLPDEDKLNRKNDLLNQAKMRYNKLVKDNLLLEIDWSSINNAYLLSFKSYHQDQDLFDDLFAAVEGDFTRFIEEVRLFGNTAAPFVSLRQRVNVLVHKP